MKNITFLSLFAFSMICFAQNRTKNVGDFNELKVYDLIQVELIKSDENKIEVWGDHTDDVEIVNKKGKLKIRLRLEKSYHGEDTKVTLYYTNCSIIDVNEGAKVNVQQPIEQNFVELKAQEGGEINAEVAVNNLKVQAYSGGIINADGKANSQSVNINTGGIYDAQFLESKTAKVKIQAAGQADVFATDLIKARVNAGGTINIYGNPKDIDKKTTFGGEIVLK